MEVNSKRVNGFSFPLGRTQVVTAICYLYSVASYFVLAVQLQPTTRMYVMMLISVLVTTVVTFCWYWTQSTDPEAHQGDISSGFHCPCSSAIHVLKNTRYCASCHKQVLEMDHHCTFLNNCIGGKNYTTFLGLVYCTCAQMLLHTIFGIMVCTSDLWHEDGIVDSLFHNSSAFYYVLVGTFIAISGIGFLLSFVLGCFHGYLIVIAQTGTFDWMMENRMKAISPQVLGFDEASVDSESLKSYHSGSYRMERKSERARQAARENYQRAMTEAQEKRRIEREAEAHEEQAKALQSVNATVYGNCNDMNTITDTSGADTAITAAGLTVTAAPHEDACYRQDNNQRSDSSNTAPYAAGLLAGGGVVCGDDSRHISKFTGSVSQTATNSRRINPTLDGSSSEGEDALAPRVLEIRLKPAAAATGADSKSNSDTTPVATSVNINTFETGTVATSNAAVSTCTNYDVETGRGSGTKLSNRAQMYAETS